MVSYKDEIYQGRTGLKRGFAGCSRFNGKSGGVGREKKIKRVAEEVGCQRCGGQALKNLSG